MLSDECSAGLHADGKRRLFCPGDLAGGGPCACTCHRLPVESESLHLYRGGAELASLARHRKRSM